MTRWPEHWNGSSYLPFIKERWKAFPHTTEEEASTTRRVYRMSNGGLISFDFHLFNTNN